MPRPDTAPGPIRICVACGSPFRPVPPLRPGDIYCGSGCFRNPEGHPSAPRTEKVLSNEQRRLSRLKGPPHD